MNESIKHIGSYAVETEIGRGGMGVVYRATDTRLGRAVAIKALPEEVAQNRERLARFEREAKLLASLSHQNIATLFGLEEHDGERYLVMELAEGDTLAELIDKGPIPIDDALEYALQIADGLEAAHERGIIHRDLKPANVIVSPEGRVKILDFGLAKASQPEVTDDTLAHSPTLTAPMTAAGTILGTAAYMSPEQVRGRAVDTRADIWAFGVVLWEMLVGRRLFGADSASDVLAGVLRDTPDWEVLPGKLPSGVNRLLRRCLRRDPVKRLRHIGDARLELEEATEEPPPPEAGVPPGFRSAETLTESKWALTTDVCRHLNRETLDPTVIGDKLSYLDNERQSDVLVVCLPGFGFDRRRYAETLRRSPYRGIAVTLFGFEESRRRRPPLPIADHLTILRLFLESVVVPVRPRTTVLVGFSSGADMVLRLISEGGVDSSHIDGVLALSPNANLGTCFFTRRVAEIPEDGDEKILDIAREVAGAMATPQAWLQITPYLVELVRKYHADIDALRTHGRDIIAPFLGGGDSPLAGWYRTARETGLGVRLVFAGDEESEQAAVRDLMLAHVDHQIFGPDFNDADIVIEPNTWHIGLMEAEVIERHVEEFLGLLRKTNPPNR
jgi:serine/threonine protein kinase